MNQETIPSSVKDIAQALVDDLKKEALSIDLLESHLDDQLIALRSQERNSLDELTIDTSNEVNKLQILQESKQQHIRLLSDHITPEVKKATMDTLIAALDQLANDELMDEELLDLLKQLHNQIPERARTVREKSKELAYSLQYALHLGHQMIEAIQGATSSPPMLIYTAAGSKKISTSKRMMVNKVG